MIQFHVKERMSRGMNKGCQLWIEIHIGREVQRAIAGAVRRQATIASKNVWARRTLLLDLDAADI